ncbi:ABC transporter substrate-binding protein [Treponema sp.]
MAEKAGIWKARSFFNSLILIILIVPLFFGCGRSEKKAEDEAAPKGLILGFSQIGAESAWRTCNTRSVQEAAANSGIQLVFTNAEQKQENQIKAIRSFIAYQVDVIAFVPIVADGWDNVLKEAQDAGIPVLITDRKIHTADESLYAGFIGTDSLEEGRAGARFLISKFKKKMQANGKPRIIRILEISGTEGSSVAIGRAEGFREGLLDHPEFQITESISGDFLKSKGYEIMRGFEKSEWQFDAVFSHNDGMTLGMIEAMHEKGMRPGKDVVIVTIDAEQAAIDALRRGEVNCVIECNPKIGPAIMDLARKMAAGLPIPKQLHVNEQVFTEDDDLAAIEDRGY